MNPGTHRSWIPEIDDATLAELHALIRPLVRRGDVLHVAGACDPRGASFPWVDPNEPIDSSRLVVVKHIVTYHRWAYYSFFKPSAAEVLAMIPPELRDEVSAYEVEGPDTASDLNRHHAALDAGYHVAITTLYRGRVAP